MRLKGKWRSTPGKDKVKEASKRLRVILKTSRKLAVASDDLNGLGVVSQLRAACRGYQDPSSWLFFGLIILAVLLGTLILTLVCGGLPDILTCGNTTSKVSEPLYFISLKMYVNNATHIRFYHLGMSVYFKSKNHICFFLKNNLNYCYFFLYSTKILT